MKKYLFLIGLFLTSTLFAQTPIQVEARIDSHVVQNSQKKIRGDSLHDILVDMLYADNAPALMQDGFVVTPTVTWITGYTYQVSPAVYVIGGVLYTSPSTSITLDAADATNDRIDLFVLTTSSTAIDVTGTPAATPVEPDIDAQTQLRVSFALVQASTTQPSIANEWIYQENIEWVYSDNTANLNPASINNPYDGTLDIEGTTVANTNRFIMTPATFPSLVNYNAVVFKIRSKAAWGTRRVLIQFMNGATPIGSAASFGNNAYGFNSLVTGSYQNIAIPLIDFGNVSGATALRFQASMTSGTIGFYIDDIQLTGISTTTAITGGAHQILYFDAAGNITSDPGARRNMITRETFIEHSVTASDGIWFSGMSMNVDTLGAPYISLTSYARNQNGGGLQIDTGQSYLVHLQLRGGDFYSSRVDVLSDSIGFAYQTASVPSSYYFPTSSDSGKVMMNKGSGLKMEWRGFGSGAYTPTLFNVTNIAASTAYECQWLRVDSTVTVSGKVDIDVTLGAASELGMSLPIASNFTAEQNLGGTGSSAAAASLVSAVRADGTNDRAAFVFTAVSLTNDSYFFEFTYRIK